MLAALFGCFLALSLSPASAASANISQAYKTDQALTAGQLVSLDARRPDYVEPAQTANGSRLLGVTVISDDSLLAIEYDGTAAGQVQVATSGIVSTMVSDLGGDIRAGDAVAVSPFRGIGMKAPPGSRVIGLARTAFDGRSPATTQTITDKQGQSTRLRLGSIRLDIQITTKPPDASSSGLQRLAQSLTGRTVSTNRIIISLVVAVVASIALITLTYASIYSSIISVGRNPLAKYAIFRTLTAVMIMALLTAVVASLTIFFLLR